MATLTARPELRLEKPLAGQQHSLRAESADIKLVLHFEPGTATMNKDGQALVFTFDDGSSIRIEGFYDTYTKEDLPVFVLGEAEIDAATFFAANEELMPAAGAAAAASGGRYNDFGSSELMDGNQALAGLEPGQNPSIEPLGTLQAPGGLEPATAPGLSLDPGAGGGPDAPALSGPQYDARAVLFTQDATNQSALSFSGLTLQSLDDVTWQDASYAAYFEPSLGADGTLSLSLTQEGRDALAALGSDNLYSYVTINTDKGPFTVQIVLNQNDHAVSGELDNIPAEENGGFNLVPGGLRHGEWHEGQRLENGTLQSSNLDDHIRFSGLVSGSSIDAGEGVDTIELGGLQGSNTVVSQGGSIDIHHTATGKSVAIDTAGGSNTVQSESANIHISATQTGNTTNTGNYAWALRADGGDNTVTTGKGDIEVTVDPVLGGYGMQAKNGGSNSLEATEGSVTLSVNASKTGGANFATALESSGNGSNTITAGENIDITVDKVMHASGIQGQANLTAGNNLTMNIHGAGGNTYGVFNSGATRLEAVDGTLKISVVNDNGPALAANNASGTSMDLLAGDEIRLSAQGGNSSYALSGFSAQGSVNAIAGNDIELSATSTENSRGVLSSQGTMKVQSLEGDISIQSNSSNRGTLYNYQTSTGAIGVSAYSGSNTTIQADNGTVSLLVNQKNEAQPNFTTGTEAWGILNEGRGGEGVVTQTTIQAETVHIAVDAAKRTSGLEARTGAENLVQANTIRLDINKNADAPGELSRGMTAGVDGGGSNTLRALNNGEGQVIIEGKGQANYAMNAVQQGQNTIEADQVRIHMQGTGNYGQAASLMAQGNGKNTILANDTRIEASGEYNTTGMFAGYASQSTGQAAENLVQATGDAARVEVISTASGNNAKAYGLQANSSAVNTINEASGANLDSVQVQATAGQGSAYGLYSLMGGENTISGAQDVLVSANLSQTAEGGLNASGKGDAYGLTAMTAQNGQNAANSIEAENSITVLAGSASAKAYGLHTVTGGNNSLEAQTVDVHAKGASAAYGLYAGGGENTLRNAETATVSAETTAAGGQAFGLWAGEANGGNRIENTETVNINAKGGSAWGVLADKGSAANSTAHNDIQTENLTVDAKATGTAKGLATNGAGTENILKATETVDISAQGTLAYGIHANQGINTLEAGDMSINAQGLKASSLSDNYSAYGVRADNSGKNSLTSAGDINITAHSQSGYTWAVSAVGQGENTIKAQNLEILASNEKHKSASGIIASNKGTNLVDVGEGTIRIQSDSYGSRTNGIFVETSVGTGNTLNAGVVDIQATSHDTSGENAAYGLYSTGGVNRVNISQSASVAVQSAGNATDATHGAYAMRAYGSAAANTISATEDARGVQVYITATSGALNKAYAMLADGGVNLIQGSKGGDLVRLAGMIEASGSGKNRIETGSGNDRIELDGKIANATSLGVKGGEGYDTLVLHAKDFADFTNRYGAWLKGNTLSGIEIEHIQVVLDSTGVSEQSVLDWFTSNMPTASGLVDVDVAYDHSAQLADTSTAHADFDHTAYAVSDGEVAGKDFHFNSAGDDYVHIKDNVHDSTFQFDAGHDSLRVDGSFSASVVDATANTDGLQLHIGNFESGTIELGSGKDWIVLGGMQEGTVLDGNYGTMDNLVLQLGSTADLTGKFDLGGVDGIENLWLDLANGQKDAITDDFLNLASKALSGANVYILHDQSDALDFTNWHAGDTVMVDNYDGTSITFTEYTSQDDANLKIYVELLGSGG